VAWLLGLDTAQQAMVGLAAIIGHNWSVFLGFHGGRGVLTTIGLSLALPLLNSLLPWELVTFLLVAAFGIFILRNPPLGIISAVAAMPIVSLGVSEPLDLTLGFTGMLLVVVTKRLVAPRTPFTCKVSLGQLLLNRLILDRDIGDREAWIRYATREIKSTSQEKAE
jgi:glycerol-3-phosphate acyltransferase PlsY